MGDGTVSDVSFSSDVVSSNGGNGICLYGNGYVGEGVVSNVAVSSCTMSSNRGSGIYLHGLGAARAGRVCNVSVSSSKALFNDGNGFYMLGDGGTFSYLYNVSISLNMVSSNQNGICLAASMHNTESTHDITMSANIVSANYQSGIIVQGGMNSNITHNSISYNMYGVYYSSTTNNLANYNDIYRNLYGMNVTNGATVNAEYDYWGDSTGPYQPSVNPDGKGNPVNGNGVDLDFIQFLTSPQGPINQRPVAVLWVDKNYVGVGETVSFNGTASTDDGRIDYYFFDFGDGTNSSWTTLPVVTHKYSQQKTYNATLMVMDDFGVTSNNTQQAVMQVIVVPEFPSILVLPLFMIATLLAVIVYRRKCIQNRKEIAKEP
jgi:hypothetical protein